MKYTISIVTIIFGFCIYKYSVDVLYTSSWPGPLIAGLGVAMLAASFYFSSKHSGGSSKLFLRIAASIVLVILLLAMAIGIYMFEFTKALG